MNIQIAGLNFDSIVDGPGLRNTLFVQGCSHHCVGCHNAETWNPQGGKGEDTTTIIHQLLNHKNKRVTFSGGEPFEQAIQCELIAKALRENHFNLWSYSGYTFEEIIKDPIKKKFLEHLDVLVDGRFDLSQKSYNLYFKGSKNQRVIDVQQSLKKNNVVLYETPLKSDSQPLKLYI